MLSDTTLGVSNSIEGASFHSGSLNFLDCFHSLSPAAIGEVWTLFSSATESRGYGCGFYFYDRFC